MESFAKKAKDSFDLFHSDVPLWWRIRFYIKANYEKLIFFIERIQRFNISRYLPKFTLTRRKNCSYFVFDLTSKDQVFPGSPEIASFKLLSNDYYISPLF